MHSSFKPVACPVFNLAPQLPGYFRTRFLSDLHSNPFIFPFEQCFPPESPATFVRCCNAHRRHQLPNRDCWGRPLLQGAQAKYLQSLHKLRQSEPLQKGGDAQSEADWILQEVSRHCSSGECHQQHAPYNSLQFLEELSRSFFNLLQVTDLEQDARLEHPGPAEYKRWRSWQNRSLTNPLDCCGLEIETLARSPVLRPRPFLDEYYEQKWPPALTEMNRVERDLFSCQGVLVEIALHELVVLYIHSGSPAFILRERKSLPPRARRRYLKWSERCAYHYSKFDRLRFWAQSLLDFTTSRVQVEPRQDQLFVDVLPANSTVYPEGRAAVKQFGILVSCTQQTQAFCRLPVGLWQCYARKHSHNTEVWYREQIFDFNSAAALRCFLGSRPTGSAREQGVEFTGLDRGDNETRSFYSWRTSFNSLPFSSMCLLYHEALHDKWRTKRMAADVFAGYEWHLLVDGGDVTVGPDCFNENLEKMISTVPDEASIVVKDPSELEDSNGGVVLVRRSPLGKLFLDLMLDKISWPMQLIGSGCYFDQPSMNEALLEILAWETGAEYNSDCLPHMFIEPVGDGHFQCNYLAHLLCFKSHLRRMAGPFGNRSSRKVFFLPPHAAADMNFRPFGNVPDGAITDDLASFRWRPFLWHWVNYGAKRKVMLQHHGLAEDAEASLPPCLGPPFAVVLVMNESQTNT